MQPGLINNREFASLFWLGVVAAWLLVGHRETTVAVCRDLVRSTSPLAAYFVLYGIWIGVVSWLGTRLGLWDRTLLKETVLWTVLSGLGLLAGTTAAMKRGWFRKTVLATVGAPAVLEFVVNAKSSPLVVEVLLQPVVCLAIVLPVVARDPEHRPVRSLAGWVAALVGFTALGWTVLAVIEQWAEIERGQLLREAVLPVWLTVGAVGFLYPFTLYMSYEQLLKRMRWIADDRSVWPQAAADSQQRPAATLGLLDTTDPIDVRGAIPRRAAAHRAISCVEQNRQSVADLGKHRGPNVAEAVPARADDRPDVLTLGGRVRRETVVVIGADSWAQQTSLRTVWRTKVDVDNVTRSSAVSQSASSSVSGADRS